jgi:hypothetical protein
MASDIIQRAAVICGYPFTPNSDQLAAWLGRKQRYVVLHQGLTSWHASVFAGRPDEVRKTHRVACGSGLDLLTSLSAAVVEVDRIEREKA